MSYGYVTPLNGFGIEAWFNRSALPVTHEVLISQQSQNRAVAWSTLPYTNGRQFIIYFEITTGNLVVEFRDNSGSITLSWVDPASSPGYANDGAWHHVALRVEADKRSLYIYVDGHILYQTTLISVIDWVPGVLAIGGTYAPHLGNYGTYLYSGGVAYVAVWDTALTHYQVTLHYTAGIGGAVFYGDDEVTRLKRLFSYCGVPVNSQRFDTPVSSLQGLAIAGVNGLEAVKADAKNAGGMAYADGQGIMVYQSRRHRYNRPLVATLTEEAASAPDIGMEFSTDDTKVVNDVRASRPNGGSARLRNLSSMDEYGSKTVELTLGITSDDEMRNAGTWLVERYGEDRLRVSAVTLSAESSDLIQYLVETLDIGDRLAFADLPNNVPQTYMEFLVEAIGVEANFKDETWTLTLVLSPGDLWNVMQVGVSTLGDGSRIAF